MSHPVRITCATCTAPYDPSLVAWACPVCDTPAPGGSPRARLADDDRLTAIVLAGTLLNIVLLAALAAIVLSR